MPLTFAKPINDFATTLSAAHAIGDGTLSLSSADGLTALGADEIYRVTVGRNMDTAAEVILGIFEATGLAGSDLTGVTAAEGYADSVLSAGYGVQIRPTAKTITELQDAIRANLAALEGKANDPVVATGTTTARTIADRFAESIHCKDFGAVGDDIADDTAAIRAWVNACIFAGGRAVWDRPPVGYRITDTILIEPPLNGSQVHLDMDCLKAYPGLIRWAGGNGKPVIRAVGWKLSSINNISISIPDSSTGVIGWDLDNTGAAPSLSDILFTGCRVDLGTGSTSCHGWRLGHGTEWNTATDGEIDQNGDISFLTFLNCTVNGVETGGGNAAWRSEHQNVLNNCWYNGGASHVDRAISNIPSAGAAASGGKGGQSIFTYGFGTSRNLVDFEFGTVGSYSIHGGRFEVGTTFLKVPDAGNAAGMAITVNGAELGGYDLAGGNVFDINSSVNLHLDAVTAYANAMAYNSGFIKLASPAGVPGSLTLTSCLVAGANPFHSITAGSGPWTVRIDQCQLIDTGGLVTGTIDDRSAELAAKADLSAVAIKGADNTLTGANTFTTYTTFDSIGVGGTSSLKFNVAGTSDTETHVVGRLSSDISGAGAYYQLTDGFTYNVAFGAGSDGSFEVWAGRFPGNAGTRVLRITPAGVISGDGSGLTGIAQGTADQVQIADGAGKFAASLAAVTPAGVARFQRDPSNSAWSPFTALALGDASGTASNGGQYGGVRKDRTKKPFTGVSLWDDGATRSAFYGGGGWLAPAATHHIFCTCATYDELDDQDVQRLIIYPSGQIDVNPTGTPLDDNATLSVRPLAAGGKAISCLGPLGLATLADIDAPDDTIYFGSDHLDPSSNAQLCRKQGGAVTVIG